MEHMELSYEMAGGRNYLSVLLSEEVNSYQLKMLENNKIDGILPVHSLRMNGVYKLQYDITGKSRLVDWLKQGTGSREARRKMLYSFVDAMIHAEDYLLTCKQFLLEKEYIYLDGHGKVFFVYLPFAEREAAEPGEIQNFLKNLLLEHFTSDEDNYFLNLLRYVNLPEYSLAGMSERLEGETPGELPELPREKPGKLLGKESGEEPEKLSGKEPAKLSEEELGKLSGKEPGKLSGKEPGAGYIGRPPVNVLSGVAIPGMPSAPFSLGGGEESGKGKKKEKKEKERKGIFWPHKKAEEPGENNFFSKIPEKKLQGSCPENEDTPWKGTQMIGFGEEERGTIILDSNVATETAFLAYGNERIPIAGVPFYIGREKGDYLLRKPNVSGKHAYIGSRKGSYFIVDENSTNHTYVNGKVIAPYTEIEIVSGDTIRLASETMTFHVENQRDYGL